MELPLRLLFLCTGNSCRSVMAEALANELGQGRLRAFSAGSAPKGEVNPRALAVLNRHGIATEGLASQSWAAFRERPLDAVITVCSQAQASCPVWLGQAVKAHWGLADPDDVTGDDDTINAAFQRTYDELHRRIEALAALPLASLSPNSLQQALTELHEHADSDTV